MKSTIAIYNSHRTALDAVEVLKNRNYSVNQLSLIGQVKTVDDNKRIESVKMQKNESVSIGAALSTTLKVLSGAAVFAVPEFGYFFGAGAVKKVLAGFIIGLVGGEIVLILTAIGIKKDKVVKYSEHLNEGKFLLIAQGNEEEVENAKKILCNCGKYLELCVH